MNGKDRYTSSLPVGKREDDISKIGHYQILSKIGKGGMGRVFLAADPQLSRNMALKMLEKIGEAEARRFIREARVMAKLNHDNIVRVYKCDFFHGVPYIVMDYIPGSTLEQFLSQKSCSLRLRLQIIATVARAMHYAHEMGVVHRDLKPANILIDDNGKPYVADFGLAKSIAVDKTLTKTGQVIGTPSYMAPEQAKGPRRMVDRRSDIYSLGTILYEIVSGVRVVEAKSPIAAIFQVIHDKPRPLREIDPEIPDDIGKICDKALAKSPAHRYQTAWEMAEDIEAFLAGKKIGKKRSKAVSLSVVVIIIAIAILLGLLVVHTREKTHWKRTVEQNVVPLREAPTNSTTAPYHEIAVAKVREKDYAEARKNYAIAGELYYHLWKQNANPQDADKLSLICRQWAHLLQGETHRATLERNFVKALEYYRELERCYLFVLGIDANIYTKLSQMYFAWANMHLIHYGDVEKTKQYCQKALDAAQQKESALHYYQQAMVSHHLLSVIALKNRKMEEVERHYRDAEKWYSTAIDLDSQLGDAYIQRANLYQNFKDETGKYRENAEVDLQQATKLLKDSPFMWINKGDLYLFWWRSEEKRGDELWRQCWQMYEKALRCIENRALPARQRDIDETLSTKLWLQTAQEARQLVQMRRIQALVQLGHHQLHTNNATYRQSFRRAREEGDAVLAKDAKNFSIYDLLADSYEMENKGEQALSCISRAISLLVEHIETNRFPDKSTAHKTLAAYYQDRGRLYMEFPGDFAKAKVDFDKAIANDIDNAELYIDRGKTLFALLYLEEALRDHTRAIRLATLPKVSKSAYVHRSFCHFVMHDYAQAEKDLTSAKSFPPLHSKDIELVELLFQRIRQSYKEGKLSKEKIANFVVMINLRGEFDHRQVFKELTQLFESAH